MDPQQLMQMIAQMMQQRFGGGYGQQGNQPFNLFNYIFGHQGAQPYGQPQSATYGGGQPPYGGGQPIGTPPGYGPTAGELWVPGDPAPFSTQQPQPPMMPQQSIDYDMQMLPQPPPQPQVDFFGNPYGPSNPYQGQLPPLPTTPGAIPVPHDMMPFYGTGTTISGGGGLQVPSMPSPMQRPTTPGEPAHGNRGPFMPTPGYDPFGQGQRLQVPYRPNVNYGPFGPGQVSQGGGYGPPYGNTGPLPPGVGSPLPGSNRLSLRRGY